MFLTVCLNPTLQKTLCFPVIVTGSVNRTAEHRLDVSGKGINVTRVLTQLGKKALHLTQLGGHMQPLFLSLCEQDGLSVEWVESESQIRFCYTVINGSNGDVTELIEESEPVSPGTEERLMEKFNLFLESSSLHTTHSTLHTIISGTKAAGFSDAVIPTMVCKAKEKGLFVILDIKGNDLKECLKYEPDIIKPNLEEFIDTFKTEPSKDLLIEITQKHKCGVILTDGSRKILAADKDSYYEVEVPSVKVVNTIGSGDAFTAGLASALSDKADFNTAINEGIRYGALNAGLIKPGVIR